MKITDILSRLRGKSSEPVAPAETKYKVGDVVKVGGFVGRIDSVRSSDQGNFYSVKLNYGGTYEHGVPENQIRLIS